MTIAIDDYFNEVICDNGVRIRIGDYGLNKDLILAVEEVNERKLSEDEIKIIENASASYDAYKEQKEIRNESFNNSLKVHGIKRQKGDEDKPYVPRTQKAHAITIQSTRKKSNDDEEADNEILKDRNASPAEKKAFLVEEILLKINIKTLKDTDEILYWKNGVYCRGGEKEILVELQKLGGYEITNSMRGEVLSAIRAQTYVDRDQFDADSNILNVKNGLLNLETKELKEHDPAYLSFTQIPVEYNPKAACPNIMKFITTVADTENQKKIVRMLGYCLLKSSKYQRAFMFVGSGSNGKGTLINLITAFLGKQNISNKTIQALASDRFACADLHGKMVNACADLPEEMIQDSGNFKMLVSGDEIDAQRKHEHPFTFRNYAKLIFSANTIPKSKDKTYTYFRRWIIIPFRKTFEGTDDDPNLIDKMTTPEELSGLLNVALVGLKRLNEERGFPQENVQKIQQIYENNASLVQNFIAECCAIDLTNKECYVEAERFRDAYIKYCESQGTKTLDANVLGEELRSQGIEHTKKRINGNRRYYYIGIRLQSDAVQSGLAC